jgi:hypothetical protein
MRRSDEDGNVAYRAALVSGRWILALTVLLSTAMRPEDLTTVEMERVVTRFHQLRAIVQ